MNVLAFDTCLGACSAAVMWRGQLPAEGGGPPPFHSAVRFEEMTTGHAERLLPMIAEVLRESAVGLDALEAIAVTEGPGTFTGVRVGVAAARGLGLATGLPVRATTCLHVMAHQALAELGGDAHPEGVLAVCVEARRGQVYVQAFDRLEAAPLTQAAVLAPEGAAQQLAPGQPLMCVGSGARAVAAAAARHGRPAEARLDALNPDAGTLARIAPALPVRKPVVPLYLRPPDARPQAGGSLPRLA